MDPTLGVILSATISAAAMLVVAIISGASARKRVRLDTFTAITAAQDKRIADLEGRVAARDAQLESTKAENTTLRDELSTMKATVSRYLQRVADAWRLGGPMPIPDQKDLAWLELEIPPAPPTGTTSEKEGAL